MASVLLPLCLQLACEGASFILHVDDPPLRADKIFFRRRQRLLEGSDACSQGSDQYDVSLPLALLHVTGTRLRVSGLLVLSMLARCWDVAERQENSRAPGLRRRSVLDRQLGTDDPVAPPLLGRCSHLVLLRLDEVGVETLGTLRVDGARDNLCKRALELHTHFLHVARLNLLLERLPGLLPRLSLCHQLLNFGLSRGGASRGELELFLEFLVVRLKLAVQLGKLLNVSCQGFVRLDKLVQLQLALEGELVQGQLLLPCLLHDLITRRNFLQLVSQISFSTFQVGHFLSHLVFESSNDKFAARHLRI
mmetsp:Transcript_11840/g.27290  ORF Transcript_11840/g.27290 Transcript_11840/m.27290 type:complete len:307 (-) Transcript_11840:1581-2501(-)